LRQLIGVGTPRSLQGRAAVVFSALFRRLGDLWGCCDVSRRSRGRLGRKPPRHRSITASATARERGDFHLGLLGPIIANGKGDLWVQWPE